MAKDLKKNVFYLMHDLNSGIGIIKNMKYHLERNNVEKALISMEIGIKRIEKIQDYFYKYAKE